MAGKNKQKILVVDDEQSIVEMYSMVLKAEGFSVLQASNGKEGFEKAIAQTPDLILLDVLMPVMNGLDMLQQLRQTNDYGKKVPVIFLTNLSAGSDENIIKKIAETEPVHYIIKVSLKPNEVVKKVKERLSASSH